MEHEGIGIGPEFRHDERHLLSHEAGNEGDIAAEPIQLGDHDRTLTAASQVEGGGELRALIEGIGPLPRLNLHMLGNDGEALRLTEPSYRGPLGFNAKAAPALLGSRNTKVADERLHGVCPCCKDTIRSFSLLTRSLISTLTRRVCLGKRNLNHIPQSCPLTPSLASRMTSLLTSGMADLTMETRWLTYDDLAAALKITPDSARRLVARNKNWPRKPGNDGRVLIGVPVERLPPDGSHDTSPDTTPDAMDAVTPDVTPDVTSTVTVLEAHIETLRAALAKAEATADRNMDDLRKERGRIETMTVDMLRLTREAMTATAAKETAERDLISVRAELEAMKARSWWRRLIG